MALKGAQCNNLFETTEDIFNVMFTKWLDKSFLKFQREKQVRCLSCLKKLHYSIHPSISAALYRHPVLHRLGIVSKLPFIWVH